MLSTTTTCCPPPLIIIYHYVLSIYHCGMDINLGYLPLIHFLSQSTQTDSCTPNDHVNIKQLLSCALEKCWLPTFFLYSVAHAQKGNSVTAHWFVEVRERPK